MTGKSSFKKQINSSPEKNVQKEPIAIIGIGCRFPGGANSPEKFWSLLCNGVNAVSEIPPSRFDVDTYYDPVPATPGKMMTRWGGFLEDIEEFDAYFFGISPREAERLDPQQRLLLEVAWEALEDSGLTPVQVAGNQSGVFVGIWLNDFESRLFADPKLTDFYMTTGSGRYSASGRISYQFGMQGPSITIDTACSSSLVAVNLACQNIWSGECSVALAGGANVILQPHISIAYSQSKMMAPDGLCKFGDAQADGYVRSEGAALIVLKRLSQAIADKNPVYALIRGGAVNNDGRSGGFLTTPGRQGQEEMFHLAYRNAGIDPSNVHYVEAHGTGTKTGDPVELGALGAIVGANRSSDEPCLVGSVKTNLGHTEGAAGIAGLIKVALSLKNKFIPPSLHLKVLNPAIPWEQLNLTIPTQLTPWPSTKEAIAGVSAFGIAGTNAHVVLSEAPKIETGNSNDNTTANYLLPLSAHSPEALQDMTKSYLDLLTKEDVPILYDVCYTASCRRTHHSERVAFVGESAEALTDQLSAYLENQLPSDANRVDEQAKVVFVFPGQGGQWLKMGQELLKQNFTFQEIIQKCEQAFQPWVDWSLLEQLTLDENSAKYRLNEIGVIQPVLFALEVALSSVWRSWGIEPHAVIGHSMGETAAAYVAGALNLEDAAKVICKRSQLMQRTSGHGAMAVVGLSFSEAVEVLKGYEDKLSVAVQNSPRSTVLSGDPQALDEIIEMLTAQDIFCRRVNVDVASHSPQMDPLRPELVETLESIKPQTVAIPFYSTATEEISDGTTLNAEYWGKNLRQPVQFGNMIQKLIETNHSIFIEMGPHPILLSSIQEVSAELEKSVYGFASLRRDQPEVLTMLGELGALYSCGYSIDWDKFYPSGGRVVSLPSYPWQRERFWLDFEKEASSRPFSTHQFESQSLTSDQQQISWEQISEWLYEIKWEPVEQIGSESLAENGPGVWLIFADRSGTGVALAKLLNERGERCILVTPSENFTLLDQNHFQIRPGHLGDIKKLLEDVFAEIDEPCRGIVHLWSLDTPATESLSISSLEDAQVQNCGSVLHLVQEISQTELAERPRLWLVTQMAQMVLSKEDAPLSVGQAPLWGFGRVIAEEHPELWGGLIDLGSLAQGAKNANFLDQAIHTSGKEDQLAFRKNQGYAARLVRKEKQNPTKKTATSGWRKDSTYLITGGLGGIGIQAARWMVEHGVRRLILMGRTQIPPRTDWNSVPEESLLGQKIGAIRDIESLGASVHLATCDVANEDQLKNFLETFERENWPPIRGVLHAAGVLEDHSLLELDLEGLKKALRSKVAGSWLLHRLLGHVEIFILFSSINSILVQPGQSNYAAANAFLDTLAYHRRQLKQTSLCVNWGTWENLGMVGTSIGKRNSNRMAEEGIGSFNPSQGMNILDMLLQKNATQVIVAPIDWSKIRSSRLSKRQWPLLSHMLDELAINQVDKSITNKDANENAFYNTLLSIDNEQRKKYLEDHLRTLVSRILRLDPSRISLNKPLGSFGLDSLMGVELRNRLEADLKIKLSATVVWNYPTIDQLSSFLLSKLEASSGVNPTRVKKTLTNETKFKGRKTVKILADINSLSDEEVMKSLLTGKGSSNE